MKNQNRVRQNDRRKTGTTQAPAEGHQITITVREDEWAYLQATGQRMGGCPPERIVEAHLPELRHRSLASWGHLSPHSPMQEVVRGKSPDQIAELAALHLAYGNDLLAHLKSLASKGSRKQAEPVEDWKEIASAGGSNLLTNPDGSFALETPLNDDTGNANWRDLSRREALRWIATALVPAEFRDEIAIAPLHDPNDPMNGHEALWDAYSHASTASLKCAALLNLVSGELLEYYSENRRDGEGVRTLVKDACSGVDQGWNQLHPQVAELTKWRAD